MDGFLHLPVGEKVQFIKESETSPERKETMLIVRIACTTNNRCVTNLNLVTTFTDIPWLAQ